MSTPCVVTYQAKTFEEFRNVCLWLKEQGLAGKQAQVKEPNEDETTGPNETEFKLKTGRRMRLTNEEKGRMAMEDLDREDIAAERLALLAQTNASELPKLDPDRDTLG